MDSIKKLTDLFAEFPTVGRRTASRFVFHLISLPKERIAELTAALQDLKSKVKLCSFCYNPHETQNQLCEICQDYQRRKAIVCVVEKEADLLSIENTKRYNGFYFILGGVLTLRKNNPDSLRIHELKKRIVDSSAFHLPKLEFSEVIIALNPTPEGRATSVLVEKALKEVASLKGESFKVTRLAQGLPVGGELEYADEETLESAFEGRK